MNVTGLKPDGSILQMIIRAILPVMHANAMEKSLLKDTPGRGLSAVTMSADGYRTRNTEK